MQALASETIRRYTVPMPHPADPNTGPDDWAPEPDAGLPPDAEPRLEPAMPRRGAIDWDRTHLTPAFVRALARAQAAAKTVGKDSKIDGREGTKARMYANSDAMTDEATRVLNAEGIYWTTAFSGSTPTEKRHLDENGDKQWVCSVIDAESLLLHAPSLEEVAAGTPDEIGMLVTTASTVSIGRLGTPIDKADAAAQTFLRLYLARDVAGLDRGDANDDLDARDDSASADGRGARQRSAASAPELGPARRKAEAKWKALAVLFKTAGRQVDPAEWAATALGHDPETADDYEHLAALIDDEMTTIRAKVAQNRSGA